MNSRAVRRQVLLDAGFVTVCAGGGGVPVAVEEVPGGRVLHRRHGIEAVIDKVCKVIAMGDAAQGPACNQQTCVWTCSNPTNSLSGLMYSDEGKMPAVEQI